MDKMTIIWLVLAVLAAGAEAATPQLVSIWFAVGALAACVTSLFVGTVWIQVIVFVAVSGVALILTRPLAAQLKEKKVEHTNSDRYVGQEGVVINAIDNDAAVGQVRVGSSVWTARSADGSRISDGAKVTITAIEGVKLIVEPSPEGKASRD